MRVLGIESSCDETAVAVVSLNDRPHPELLSNVVHSQTEVHARYGGVVPEVASREHVDRIVQVALEALRPVGGLECIEGIAVTSGPGLLGALLVGLQFAKGLALARNIPWIGIHHLEGHLSAALLSKEPPPYPHLALVVSGGHSSLYEVQAFGRYSFLGGTRDDAAGEAFDKIAKMLGLGYPGGARMEREGQGGNAQAIAMPRALKNKKLPEFSFSGLKTFAAEHLRAHGIPQGQGMRDFCASAQEAICDILSEKAVLQAEQHGLPGVVLAGGVAANLRLRALVEERCRSAGLWCFAPAKSLCTDNAAMIAAAGAMRLKLGQCSGWDHPARSRWSLEDVNDLPADS